MLQDQGGKYVAKLGPAKLKERADKLKVELEAARKQAAGATSPQAQAAAQAKVADLEQRLQANADESKRIPLSLILVKLHTISNRHYIRFFYGLIKLCPIKCTSFFNGGE